MTASKLLFFCLQTSTVTLDSASTTTTNQTSWDKLTALVFSLPWLQLWPLAKTNTASSTLQWLPFLG